MTKAKSLMIDLAQQAWMMPGLSSLRSTRSAFQNTPGAFIQRLPEEKRELLRELRSDELQNVKVLPTD